MSVTVGYKGLKGASSIRTDNHIQLTLMPEMIHIKMLLQKSDDGELQRSKGFQQMILFAFTTPPPPPHHHHHHHHHYKPLHTPKIRRSRNHHSLTFQTPAARSDIFKGSFFGPHSSLKQSEWNALLNSIINSA